MHGIPVLTEKCREFASKMGETSALAERRPMDGRELEIWVSRVARSGRRILGFQTP